MVTNPDNISDLNRLVYHVHLERNIVACLQQKQQSFIESTSNKSSLLCLMWATACMQQKVACLRSMSFTVHMSCNHESKTNLLL